MFNLRLGESKPTLWYANWEENSNKGEINPSLYRDKSLCQ